MVRRGERLRLRRGSRRRALRACRHEPIGVTPRLRSSGPAPAPAPRPPTPCSWRCNGGQTSSGARRPGSSERARASSRASPRRVGRSARRVSNCFRRRFAAGRGGRSATAWRCSIAPRTRSRVFVRRRSPWHSSPRPRHVAGDVLPRSSGEPPEVATAQRSYWRSRSSTCELVSVVVPAGPLPGEARRAARRAWRIPWRGSSWSSVVSVPSSSRRRIIA